MGRRYQAILNHLGIEHYCYDPVFTDRFIPSLKMFDGIIVASPTDTHYEWLGTLARDCPSLTPVFCEKPIVKNIHELKEIFSWNLNLSMMFQYNYLYHGKATVECGSYYDYFRTGNDGPLWDCLQIIAIHNGPFDQLIIQNKAPIWTCRINSIDYNLSEMDIAYVRAIRHWINGHRWQTSQIIKAHEKVIEYKDWHDKSCDRDSGPKHVAKVS